MTVERTGTRPAPVRRAEAQGERVAHSDPFEWLARAGLLARGVVYGPVLLGIVAFGLIGFAFYSALDARYRRV